MSEIVIEVDEETAEQYERASVEERAAAVAAAREALAEKMRQRAASQLLDVMKAIQDKIAENPPTREEYNDLMRELGAEGLIESSEEWAKHSG